MDETPKCNEHSGCVADIGHAKEEIDDLWKEMTKQRDRVNGIFTRLNITLGGVCVACILLVVNMLIE